MKTSPALLALAVLLALALPVVGTGCRTTTEPVSELKTMGTVDHEFKVVWECTLEALQGEGLHPERAPRKNNSGFIETQFKKTDVDQLTKREFAVRARAQIVPVGDKNYEVRLSAGKFEKAPAESEWKWVGSDDALRQQLWRLFDKSVAKRYARKS